MSTSLKLYMTLGCHLCDDAYQLVLQTLHENKLSIAVEQIDIVYDEMLYSRYFDKIPVLQRLDGKTLHYPFAKEALINWLLSGA